MKQSVTQDSIKKEYIQCFYSAMSAIVRTHTAFRYRAHSFICKLHHACLLRKIRIQFNATIDLPISKPHAFRVFTFSHHLSSYLSCRSSLVSYRQRRCIDELSPLVPVAHACPSRHSRSPRAIPTWSPHCRRHAERLGSRSGPRRRTAGRRPPSPSPPRRAGGDRGARRVVARLP